MNELEDICKCFSMGTYVQKNDGKGQVYDTLKIEENKLDCSIACKMKTGFVVYMANKAEYNNNRKIAIDMSKVEQISPDCASAILMANRLSENYGLGHITLVNCQAEVKKFFKATQLDRTLDII